MYKMAISHFSVPIFSQQHGGEAVAAFNPNSRQNDLVDIFELFSLNQIFQLELRKLFQSQTLCITRNKYYLRRLLDPL